MADTNDSAAEKAENNSKSGRRVSLARALHVPNIARRVKQLEQAVLSDQTRPSTPSRINEAVGDAPMHITKPKSAPSVAARHVGSSDEDDTGAEIPDIPLRRSSNTINSESTASSLGTLERILAAGGLNGQHPGPLNFHPFQPQPEKRYDAQYHVPDEMSLYPLTECSWESSLPDVSEVSNEQSSQREDAPFPDTQQQRDMRQTERPTLTVPPLRRDLALSSDHSVDLPASPLDLRPASPFARGTAPSRLAESRSASLTTATSIQSFQTRTETEDQSSVALPALQDTGIEDPDALSPVNGDDLDPESFDLIVPAPNLGVYSLERRSELLFSVAHMRIIIMDPILLHRFSTFIGAYRPQSVPLLEYTLGSLKAIRAMDYVNDIISRSLRPSDCQQLQHYAPEFTAKPVPELMVNESLKQKTEAAFEALAKEDLPAYVTSIWTDIAELSLRRKIMGMMPKDLQYMSEGLAEVFCITDPSRKDNPIVFASEEFHRTTGYGTDYVLGRNCRFLQGPKTNPFSTQRIRDKVAQGKEHYETVLNYRRDGQPFMNLLLCTPLLDSMGAVRYFLGAQIDVSGLAKDCSGLESLRKLVDQDEEEQRRRSQHDATNNSDTSTARHCRDSGTHLAEAQTASLTSTVGTATTAWPAENPRRAADSNNEFRLLSEMFSYPELETVRRFGGRMHRSQQAQGQHLEAIRAWHKQRVVLHDQYEPSPPSSPPRGSGGSGGGRQQVSDAHGNININVSTGPRGGLNAHSNGGAASSGLSTRTPMTFENYLVVRPFPSLKILFASPSLRVPGILQTRLMSRIGGSQRIHEELENAFAMGQSVTAKVKWISGSLRTVSSAGTIPDNKSGASSGSTGSGTAVSGGYVQDAVAGQEGRPRWIHCTPLISANGGVGVWVVVVVDDDSDVAERKRPRREAVRQMAPPVAPPARTMDMAGRYMKSPGNGDELSAADRGSSDDGLRQRGDVVVTEREWEKGWEDVRDDSTLRLRDESQRSEVRVRVRRYDARQGKAPAAAVNGTRGDVTGSPSRGERAEAWDHVGDWYTNAKASSMDRAMGTISSARNVLLAKPASAVEAWRHNPESQQPQQQQRGNGGNKLEKELAMKRLGYVI